MLIFNISSMLRSSQASAPAPQPASYTLPVVLIYILAAASALVIKQKIMSDGGYRIVARVLDVDEQAFGLIDRLHFFASDILLLSIAIPLALLLLARLAGRTMAAHTSIALSLSVVLLSFSNLQALGSTGKMLSIDQFGPMLTWVREQPGAFFDYVSPRALASLGLLLLLAGASYWLRHLPLLSPGRHLARPAAALCALAACAAALSMAASPAPATAFHASSTVAMVRAMVSPDGARVGEQALAQAFENLNYQCDDASRPGPSRRPNIVLYIMETMPYELYASDYADKVSTLRQLEQSAYVSRQHYSTYPFTSYARFSLFTGLYPSFRLEKTLPLQSHSRYRSEFGALVEQGYRLTVFDPVNKRYPMDDWLVHQLGGKVVSADRGTTAAQKDGRVLEHLTAQIHESARSATPFVYAILPQISHGPWLPAGAGKEALYREGADRLAQLDQGLGKVVDALKQAGIYDNTVIVVTADHGLRTRNEAGFMSTEVLNKVSYHVPMVIHDPQLGRTQLIPHLTTHLDLSPTLHCLYGRGQHRIATQGMSMLSPQAKSRVVHFGGAWYNGSDGLWDGKQFHSYNRQLDMLWSSPDFEFADARPVTDQLAKKSVVDRLQWQEAMQHAVLARDHGASPARRASLAPPGSHHLR